MRAVLHLRLRARHRTRYSARGFNRQAWVLENGLPQKTVQALAQTPDGFLWVGTEAGLARFDGSGFEVFGRTSTPALPGSDVRSLLTAPDGALWIPTGEGLARWKNGMVAAFTTRNGLPSNDVRALSLDARGLVVASTAGGDAVIEGAQAVTAVSNLPGDTA